MSLGMEIMIMVALLVYVTTGIVGLLVLVWYTKAFGPVLKLMTKQLKEEYGKNEEEEA